MSNKGYSFESETEDFFLEMTGQTKKDPILQADGCGVIRVNRSFRVPGSGAMESLAGDVVTYLYWLPRQLKIECKARNERTKRDGQMITVEKEWITKNDAEGDKDNQTPVLTISFKGVKSNRIWFMMRSYDFRMLKEAGDSFKHHLYSPLPHTASKKGKNIKVAHSKLDPSIVYTYLDLTLSGKEYYFMSQRIFKDLIVGAKKDKGTSV